MPGPILSFKYLFIFNLEGEKCYMTLIFRWGKTLKIITFEKVDVSTQSDANEFTNHIRFISLS